MNDVKEEVVSRGLQNFGKDFPTLDRSFPALLSFAGAGAWVSWLQAIVEECLGNLPVIEAYLKALGVTVPTWLQPVLDWLISHYQGTKDIVAPRVDASGKTCQQGFETLAKTNAQCAKVAAFMSANKHPLINKIIENRCLAAYQSAHPGVTAIDWQAIINWVITNGPAIMQFVMMLVSLFGG